MSCRRRYLALLGRGCAAKGPVGEGTELRVREVAERLLDNWRAFPARTGSNAQRARLLQRGGVLDVEVMQRVPVGRGGRCGDGGIGKRGGRRGNRYSVRAMNARIPRGSHVKNGEPRGILMCGAGERACGDGEGSRMVKNFCCCELKLLGPIVKCPGFCS